MNFSMRSILEWTHLFVRDPRQAAQLVRAANLPLDASVLIIIVAGVISTVVSGIYAVAFNTPDLVFAISPTEAVVFERASPFVQGLVAVLTGVGLAYCIYVVGQRMGGQGSLADIMAITAVLQIAITVIIVAQFALGIVLPLLGLLLMGLSIFVFVRGVGHTVNEGHQIGNMGKSAGIAVLSFLMLVVVMFVVTTVLGLGPQGTIVEIPLGEI